MNARALVEKLGLVPHPEGGWYREIYRSPERVQTRRGLRSALTTIYYLLERGQLSRWHVVQSDEIWHFYGGAPLELMEYDPLTARLQRHVLGATQRGNTTVAVIPAQVWQAARTLGGDPGEQPGEYSLVGCTVGPGFEFEDFRFVSSLPGHDAHFKGGLAPFAPLL
jgi:predicted cupin superfamily sugar epimerase